MKQKVLIKMLADIERPQVIDSGDWIDLRCAEDIKVGKKPVTYIPLGVAMQLPKGCEAIVACRSSTPKKFHIWCSNAFGVIDNSYNGDTDEWKFAATPMGVSETIVQKNDRICQFRVQLSQKATLWQKLIWLLSSGVELVFVDHLGNEARGGFGSTGMR